MPSGRRLLKHVVQAAHNGRSDCSPSALDYRRVLESDTGIPSQMPETIERMEEEWESEEGFDANLDGGGPGCDSRDH